MVLFAIIIFVLFVIGLRTPVASSFSKDIVTVLKPFLALGIVLHHMCGETILLDEFTHWGPLVVGVFFYISGYGLTYSIDRHPNYLKDFFTDKILVKLLFPCALAFGISLCLKGQWDEFSIIERLKCPQGPWLFANDWFVYALVYCYLVFMIAGRAKNTLLRLGILVVGPFLLVAFTMWMGYARNWWATPIAFSVGALYSHFEVRIRKFVDGKKRYILTTSCLLVVFGLLMGVSAMFKSNISTIIVYSFMPLLLANIMIRLDVKRLARNEIILFFSGISFELYLIHGIVIEHLRHSIALSGILLVSMALGTSYFAAYLFKQILRLCKIGASNLYNTLILNE